MCGVSDFCVVSLNAFQLNEAAKRLSSRTNSPGGVRVNEVSCMGTESVGRGITTVFFKHVSHQSCQGAVEQTMASCCIWGVCRKQLMLNRSKCQDSDPFIKKGWDGERVHIKHTMGGNLLYNWARVMWCVADRCASVVTAEKQPLLEPLLFCI